MVMTRVEVYDSLHQNETLHLDCHWHVRFEGNYRKRFHFDDCPAARLSQAPDPDDAKLMGIHAQI
eukprot:CAMPEP_0174386446 /NCGR_PEP_ID=MMETSP0811_2-20130205/127287_1 /TAXON_ID=73025 ORGANISM="Eutreptiella gymnastica-like, Strain CCMP1594" /NCGR_SAMPLE_ID=MMETSP0811_2 /ASSEMBLY_ACC=CAM_ASM_000667 /LENGTH=64 /DNA_ID=CAMNT_0015541129 /DNA_START=249 /DNA_END=443 /DNA_ORIENTATION=-